jgi:hypothetical protein
VGVPLVQRNRHQKENRNFSTKSTKEENILLKFAPSPYPIFVSFATSFENTGRRDLGQFKQTLQLRHSSMECWNPG